MLIKFNILFGSDLLAAANFGHILLNRPLNKICQIHLHCFQCGHVDIHHVPGFVVTHLDIVVQAFIQTQVIEGVLGGEVGGG